MKALGIFLAYPPVADIKREGLGRYIVAFIKSATANQDVRVVIAAPSWSRNTITDLLEEAGVSKQRFEIVGPESSSLFLQLYFLLKKLRGWRRKKKDRKRGAIRAALQSHIRNVLGKLATTRNPIVIVGAGLYATAIFAVFFALAFFFSVTALATRALRRLRTRFMERWRQFRVGNAAVATLIDAEGPVSSLTLQQWFARKLLAYRNELFYDMHRNEIDLIAEEANKQSDVRAWYLPTAFWITSHRLNRPQLICVPDVVFTEFPAMFARIGGSSVMDTFTSIERVLREGRNFVTYSERTKNEVLVKRFEMAPEIIRVVPHAAIDLARFVDVSGFKSNDRASRRYCRALLAGAISKSVNPNAVGDTEFKFLIYPSQFRPSKNILTLLSAYRFLLREKFVGHKLILTGDPHRNTEVQAFIDQHNLELDVLFLKDLSEAELAGCYKLADLAVNPSLSEGGMPFTFTEALSVGTPVVMGDIEVTREIIVDPELREATLFDPYDWRAIADKIEWALANRDELYAKQRKFYDDVLSKRTWENVVDEHIAIMDELADADARKLPARAST